MTSNFEQEKNENSHDQNNDNDNPQNNEDSELNVNQNNDNDIPQNNEDSELNVNQNNHNNLKDSNNDDTINRENIHITVNDLSQDSSPDKGNLNKDNSLKIKILNFIHFIIFLLFISIPFYPYKYIKICIFFPFILSIIWVIFKGCPFNKYTNNKDGSFVYELLRIPFPNINIKMVNELITLISVSIVLLCYIRICLREKISLI